MAIKKTQLLLAIDRSPISDINRLIVIDWYLSPSIVVDSGFIDWSRRANLHLLWKPLIMTAIVNMVYWRKEHWNGFEPVTSLREHCYNALSTEVMKPDIGSQVISVGFIIPINE